MKDLDVTLDQLYEFLDRGSMSNAPQSLVDYVQLLDKVRGMIIRFDIYGNRDGVIKALELEGMSRYKAVQIYSEAIEYFYSDSEISKAAWKNFYADKMDKAINMAIRSVKDVSDLKKVVDMIKEAGAMRELHVPDKEEVPEDFYDKPVTLMTLDPSIFEFGAANRKGLEAFIDGLPELTEKERIRIKAETRLIPLKIFQDEQEDPRKS